MDESGLAHHLPHLVALQMSDEMEGGPLIGALLQLGRHLLHGSPQSVHSGGDGLLKAAASFILLAPTRMISRSLRPLSRAASAISRRTACVP